MSPRASAGGPDVLAVDPAERFDLSPYLFMQFMEPLGSADASVEAAWDFAGQRWREDFVQTTAELAPTLIRWGGIFSDYYRWREGVGPRDKRKAMLNLCWGGTYANQVGTAEFVDLCRRVGADPLIGVNFASDGRRHYARPRSGGVRTAGPAEAAAWVDYCNNSANAVRRRHGHRRPFDVRLWQIGNETSYSKAGFDCETAARRTLAFARAMRRADPDIDLIGWGDDGWAPRMLEVAGEHLKYLALHVHFDSTLPDSPLTGTEYRRNPARTWRHLMSASAKLEAKLAEMRREVGETGVGLALTEGHFYLYPHNQCDVLRSWAAGVAYGRLHNVHARHGDLVKIATLADFCGNRWTVNAVMIRSPGNESYLMPVARVMSLFRRHVGRKAVEVTSAPAGLDVTASRRGKKVFLHVVNTRRTQAVRARLAVAGKKIARAAAFEIAADPTREIDDTCGDLFAPRRRAMPASGRWAFPAASVTAVELTLQ